MTVTVLYFARLRELLGVAQEEFDAAALNNVASLLALLRQRGGVWQEQLAPGKAFRVAVNQDMADPATPIRAGDEVAVFPPVTGG